MKKLFVVLCWLFVFTLTASAYNLPVLHRHINDHAGLLSYSDQGKLEQILSDILKKTGIEIVVVTIIEPYPLDVDSYIDELFDTWATDRNRQKRGLLILASQQDRLVRVKFGQGLSGSIPENYLQEAIIQYFAGFKKELRLSDGVLSFAALIVKTQGFELPGLKYQLTRSEKYANIIRYRESFAILPISVILFIVFKYAVLIIIMVSPVSGKGDCVGGDFGCFGGGFDRFGGAS